MYFKLAINNVKKSFKDYTIYFLTLTFAVCIFYSFNSIDAQKDMMGIKKQYLELMSNGMSYISIFVSVILGGLIIYANNFLIKRRKKELGLYMSLGMSKGKMSKLLVIEELLIGIGSLIIGLIAGMLISQLLAIITSKLFEVNIIKYQFIVSVNSIIKTIIYFGVIFLIVMIFNTFNISKYKLIDLLNAHKKGEKNKIKNPFIAGILFIISIVMIVFAYKLILKIGLDFTKPEFKISILLGIVGTVLFFYGLTSFLIVIIQKNKKIYLKKLNIFTLRQMNSKINTNFISMAVICLMLFLTISILSTGVGFKKQNIDNIAKYDASVTAYFDKNKKDSIKNILDKTKFKIISGDKYAYINLYDTKVSFNSLLGEYANGNIKETIENGHMGNIKAIPLSEFNELRALNGEKPLKLDENKFLIQSNMEQMRPTIENFIKKSSEIQIENKKYTLEDNKLIENPISTQSAAEVLFNIIVPDSVVNGLEINQSFLDIQYGNDKDKSQQYYTEFFKNNNDFNGTFLRLTTKIETLEVMNASTALILYIALYLGIIFLISSAAVLALQQLSEASDSAERYNSLRRIGAPEKMINKTIFIQTLSYFMLPLALAIVHSVVAIKVTNSFIALYGKPSIISSSLLTMVFIIIVYSGYFIATYFGYKNIVKKI
ncbi:FtsX-like permease family protein [Clostridium sp.]|uniref:FtsX-like permease family protein n=1 Tax=Clostridium sp. TaxID=1506 RepID=UPI0026DAE741|nr:ABC transporter permease [Clostridium sp.]MDO5038999.1 ABC transporter permease [Clostridium sp.]